MWYRSPEPTGSIMPAVLEEKTQELASVVEGTWEKLKEGDGDGNGAGGLGTGVLRAIFDPIVQRTEECTPELCEMKCPSCNQNGSTTTPIHSNYWNKGCAQLFADDECYPSVIRRFEQFGCVNAKEKSTNSNRSYTGS